MNGGLLNQAFRFLIAVQLHPKRCNRNARSTLYDDRDARLGLAKFVQGGVNPIQRLSGHVDGPFNSLLELLEDRFTFNNGPSLACDLTNLRKRYSEGLEGKDRGQVFELLRHIATVLRVRIHAGRPQEANFVVKTKSLARDPLRSANSLTR